MKRIKLFEEYLNERYVEDQIPQLQITLRGTIGLTSKTEDFTKELMATLYDKYIHMVLIDGTDEYNREDRIPNNRRFNKIKYDIPLLNFTSTDHNFVSDMRARVYNKVEDLQLSADKKLFYQTFPDTNFIPKTVYSLDDIENLDLPITSSLLSETSSAALLGVLALKSAAYSDKVKSFSWPIATIDGLFNA